jgi:imidazolonepropionase-like amidohydrolase
MLPKSLHAKANIIGDNAFKGLKIAIDQNVPIAYGTDAGVYAHGDNGKQFSTFVTHGMSPIDAIRTATINAAELLDTTDRGQLVSGLRADIIAVSGNPLETINSMENVTFVMKAGKVYPIKR